MAKNVLKFKIIEIMLPICWRNCWKFEDSPILATLIYCKLDVGASYYHRKDGRSQTRATPLMTWIELAGNILNSHTVGVRYCLRCRHDRCAAIVVFFTIGKIESRSSQTLSGRVKPCQKGDRTHAVGEPAKHLTTKPTAIPIALNLHPN